MRKKDVVNSSYWKDRSKCYNRLEWANKKSYLEAFVKMGHFKRSDIVLDVGTGTGIVAHTIAPLVKQVIGLDKSQDMLEQSNWDGNKYFIKRDMREPVFNDSVFDKVTARMVFHHIIKDTQRAMNECYRILKKGGLIVFSEGVPPSRAVLKDYIEIFKLKEKRLSFLEEDLRRLLKKANFKDIKTKIVWMRKMSIKNWLANSGLPAARQKKIYDLHVNANPHFKQAYNMVVTKNDCYIDMKMLILTARK